MMAIQQNALSINIVGNNKMLGAIAIFENRINIIKVYCFHNCN